MKRYLMLLTACACSGHVVADPLTNADREAILEQLEGISEEANAKVDIRFRSAISAFRSAMSSGDEVFKLYLDCEKLVNHEQLKKPESEFREWKRRNDEKFSNKAFREALRQQLRWLTLSLEAASQDADRDRLSIEASKIVDGIVESAEEFASQRNVLSEGVMSTVFARAYGIQSVKVENWPNAPLPLATVYDQAILPPLRRTDRVEVLRSTWMKRISQEATIADLWSGEQRNGLSSTRSLAYQKFVNEALPRLKWESEKDLYKAGDEQVAAANMLTHIRENVNHESATKWAEELKALVRGPVTKAVEP